MGCGVFAGAGTALIINTCKAHVAFQVTPDFRDNVDIPDQNKVTLLTCYPAF